MKKENSLGDIIIYKGPKNEVDLKVRIEKETVWLTQDQIALLFGTKRPAITKHINNIFRIKELKKHSVSSILEHTASDGKKYKTQFYNLDMIISVGYRVNSKEATQFRVWATSVLKKHLIEGYTVNQKRILEAQEKFLELQKTIALLTEKSKKEMMKGQEAGILNLLHDYSKALTFLELYDKKRLPDSKGKKGKWILSYTEAKKVLDTVKKELMSKKEATDLFGQERGGLFAGLMGAVYQTFDKKDLYESLESKAAHLLYFIIKDHPFLDGNKRSGSFLFVYFLDKNNFLYKPTGEKKINDNALTALALLVAESHPKERDAMIGLIKNLIA